MQGRIYRFAEFELNSGEGELRANGSVIRLQDKPLRLLCALLDHPQQLVTREQLRQRMWDSRTIVDYEQGINVAAKKVRDALGDSAESPRFIETIARKGYRLLVPAVATDPTIPEALTGSSAALSVTVASGSSATPSAKQAVSRRWLLPAAAAVILCAVGLAFLQLQAEPHRGSEIHSLAVLPLQDLSAGVGQEYFADGITEELITNLAQTLPLRVISRTSVMKYRQTHEPITRIARELGVEAIVEGAVARSGDRVTVTVQLIDATQDRHLWARKYQRQFEDMMVMEDELSQDIAGQIGGTLHLQHAKLTQSHQPDPQVHELCLMGRFHWDKHTPTDLAKAEDYYQQAIARDPGYGPAYAGMADVYLGLALHGLAPLQASFAKAAAAAQHAIELDEGLADAHATLGLASFSLNPESTHGEPELRRAIGIDPSNARAHGWLAFYLFFAGRRDEALAQVALARQLDPLSASANADEGEFLYVAHRFDEARTRLRQAIELDPGFGQPYGTLALVESETGHTAEALQDVRAGLALDPQSPRMLGEAGYVLAAAGHTAESAEVLARLQDVGLRGSFIPVFSALIEIGLGRRNQAVGSLKQMVDSYPAVGLKALGQWHAFDELNTDPGYQKLLAQSRVASAASSASALGFSTSESAR